MATDYLTTELRTALEDVAKTEPGWMAGWADKLDANANEAILVDFVRPGDPARYMTAEQQECNRQLAKACRELLEKGAGR